MAVCKRGRISPRMNKSFDLFLSHNSKDKPAVRKLAKRLEKYGLRSWLDEKDLRPGLPFQEALEEAMRTTRAAAVCVGGHGLGPWQRPEVRACLSQMVERGQPVIPVLLAGAPEKPDIGLLLRENTWVDFRNGITEKELARLIWGITGERPNRSKHSPIPTAAPEAAVAGNQREVVQVAQRRPRIIVKRFILLCREHEETGEEYHVESLHVLNDGEESADSIHIVIPEFLGRAVQLLEKPTILRQGDEAYLEVQNLEKLAESIRHSRPYERGWSVKIPLTVKYRDRDHKCWSTDHAIVYTMKDWITVEIVHPDEPPEWTDLAGLEKAASRR